MKRAEWSPPRPHTSGMCVDPWCEEGCAEMRARSAAKVHVDHDLQPFTVVGATLTREREKETVYQETTPEPVVPQSSWAWLRERFGLR